MNIISKSLLQAAVAILPVIAPNVALAQSAPVDSAPVDMAVVEQSISNLEKTYSAVLPTVSCDAPTILAEKLMCESRDTAGSALWRMGRLDDMAWIYAYENATKTEVDVENPPADAAFVAARDACTDAECLRGVLIAHTNDSLGGMSPYRPR